MNNIYDNRKIEYFEQFNSGHYLVLLLVVLSSVNSMAKYTSK